MNSFMQQDFHIQGIRLACVVPPHGGAPQHKSRAANGLVFYQNGKERYDFEGGASLTVQRGDVLFLPRGTSYTVSELSPGSCIAINFDVSEQIESPFVWHLKNVGEAEALFSQAAQLWHQKQFGYSMRCKELLYGIINQMQREHHAAYVAKSKAELLAPALSLIHEGYTAPLFSIAELAALCHITPEYFRSIFRSLYGTSPLKYINTLRLTYARELIESGECTVLEAALRAGFCDAAHFSRAFKKLFGVAPVTCKR